jgi:hypothetical protein
LGWDKEGSRGGTDNERTESREQRREYRAAKNQRGKQGVPKRGLQRRD